MNGNGCYGACDSCDCPPAKEEKSNPNNCAGCDHKSNPQGGWCYMFRDEPQDVCTKHAARYSRLLACPRGCGLMAPCPDCGPTLHG